MPGVILENLSGRKLGILVSILFILQVTCFLIGGLIAPAPSAVDSILARQCYDSKNSNKSWFSVRGSNQCVAFNNFGKQVQIADRIVFAYQLPSPRDNIKLDYSRWQQNLIGVLQFDIEYFPDNEMPPSVLLTLDVKLAYQNHEDEENDWKPYAEGVIERHLDCVAETKIRGYHYVCKLIPLFELGSLHHDFYLLNIRLPVDEKKKINTDLGHVVDLWLVAINQNGGFTKVWLTLKLAFFPLIILTMIWFWNRVKQLNRSPVLLEYMLLSLGATLTFLNTPVEIFTLFFNLPFMPLFQDIRQGIFYAALLSFWLVFAGEHLMIQDPQPHHLRMYWKHLSAVAIGCSSLLVFDLFEKGSQVTNPFFSIWVDNFDMNLALTFIICAGISASIYFIFLCYMIWRVFCNISIKRSALPSMSSVRRLHYEGIIYRFKFLMLATLACAAMTIVGFILDQVSEGPWRWDDHITIEYTSAFLTGVYGMWNIYILALIILYAPSHKQWPSEHDLQSSAADGIELSHISNNEPSEISLLTSYAKKVCAD